MEFASLALQYNCKIKPKHVEYGCGIERIDAEGRVIRADYYDYSVMSIYFPSGSNPERQSFKMEFLDLFYNYITELKKTIPNLIIEGSIAAHTTLKLR